MNEICKKQESVLSGMLEIRDHIGGGSVGVIGTLHCIFAIDKATLKKSTYQTAKDFFKMSEKDQTEVIKFFLEDSENM